jgi:hypothetical protein
MKIRNTDIATGLQASRKVPGKTFSWHLCGIGCQDRTDGDFVIHVSRVCDGIGDLGAEKKARYR